MNYISTRGQAPVLNFEQVLLAGLASDGGLYVPESLPTFSAGQIAAMAAMWWTKARKLDMALIKGPRS